MSSEPVSPSDPPDRRLLLLDALCHEFEATIAYHESKGKGGQQVPFHGDFSSVGPSVVSRMRWWTREIRLAFAERPLSK